MGRNGFTRIVAVGLLALAWDAAADSRTPRPAGGPSVSVPFGVSGGRVLLPVTVNAKGTLDLILDTGMPMDGALLFEGPNADAIGLPASGEILVAGAGGGEPVPARLASGVALGVASVELPDQTVIVMQGGDASSEVFRSDGVIGYALFSRYVVNIDYEQQRVKLIEPAAFEPPEGVPEIPLHFESNVPQVDCTVETSEGAVIPLRLAIDTGAAHALSVPSWGARGVPIPAGAVESKLGRGVGGVVTGKVGRIGALRLGDHVLKNVVTSFPTADSVAGAPCAKSGNIGQKVLNRFDVTIDYPSKRLFLVPNRRFKDPFVVDMAGIDSSSKATSSRP